MSGGVQGFKRRFRETAKNTKKTRKTLRKCMASLLRRNIEDFVQEVPANGSGYPLSVPAVVLRAETKWIPETMNCAGSSC